MSENESEPIDPRLEALFWKLAPQPPSLRKCMFDSERNCDEAGCSGFRIQNMFWKLPAAPYGKQVGFVGAIVFMTEYCARAKDFIRPLEVIATIKAENIEGFMLTHMLQKTDE